MAFSNSLKKRFVSDFCLPFQVVQEPVFTYALETLDAHFGTRTKFEMLRFFVENQGGEEGFFEQSNRVKGKIIDAISNKEAYLKLQNDRLDGCNTVNNVSQQNIYNMGNVGKTFISIDLRHANFNVFRVFDPDLVLGFDTYVDLVGSVTDFDYFKQSKYLRQVIFGNLLPKKQQRLQQKLMDDVITDLHRSAGITMKSFVSASSDEVVFEVNAAEAETLTLKVKAVLDQLRTSPLYDNLRIESFRMKSIGDKSYFIKENTSTGEVTFKGVPSLIFMQVYKHYYGLPLHPNDLVFYHEGFLAEFKETVF